MSIIDPAAEAMRSRCARIAAIETDYWASVDTQSGIEFGGMGAAANICAAILMDWSAEEYVAEVRRRKATDAVRANARSGATPSAEKSHNEKESEGDL